LFQFPEEALREYGLKPFDNKKLRVVEIKPAEKSILFPIRPAGNFSQEQLKKLAYQMIVDAYYIVVADAENKKDWEEFEQAWAEIVAKGWEDEKFKQIVFKNPEGVLKEYAQKPYKGHTLKIVEMSPDEEYLFFLARPKENLSNEELHKLAAGKAVACAYHCLMHDR
jgi:hypothetical protein